MQRTSLDNTRLVVASFALGVFAWTFASTHVLRYHPFLEWTLLAAAFIFALCVPALSIPAPLPLVLPALYVVVGDAALSAQWRAHWVHHVAPQIVDMAHPVFRAAHLGGLYSLGIACGAPAAARPAMLHLLVGASILIFLIVPPPTPWFDGVSTGVMSMPAAAAARAAILFLLAVRANTLMSMWQRHGRMRAPAVVSQVAWLVAAPPWPFVIGVLLAAQVIVLTIPWSFAFHKTNDDDDDDGGGGGGENGREGASALDDDGRFQGYGGGAAVKGHSLENPRSQQPQQQYIAMHSLPTPAHLSSCEASLPWAAGSAIPQHRLAQHGQPPTPATATAATATASMTKTPTSPFAQMTPQRRLASISSATIAAATPTAAAATTASGAALLSTSTTLSYEPNENNSTSADLMSNSAHFSDSQTASVVTAAAAAATTALSPISMQTAAPTATTMSASMASALTTHSPSESALMKRLHAAELAARAQLGQSSVARPAATSSRGAATAKVIEKRF